MLINEFSKPVTLESLNENLAQRFGQKIDVSKFTREQLEDARNKLRTQISQIETNESYEAVNTDSYQKSKLFLDIINKAIDEISDSENTTPETEEKIVEGAEEQSALVMAAKDMVDRVTGWMEDTAEMQTESMLEIGDKIRDEYGIDKSEEFINTVKPALEGLFTSLESTRDSLTGGVAILTGEGAPQTMGDEVPAEEPEMEPTVDDEAGAEAEDPVGDEFGASGPAAGEDEEADRPKRESVELSKRLGLLLADSKKKGYRLSEDVKDNLTQILHLKHKEGATSISWEDLNKFLDNAGSEHYDRESFVKAYNNDPRIQELVSSFDENGVVLKGGEAPQSEPEDDTVDQMASRAAKSALK